MDLCALTAHELSDSASEIEVTEMTAVAEEAQAEHTAQKGSPSSEGGRGRRGDCDRLPDYDVSIGNTSRRHGSVSGSSLHAVCLQVRVGPWLGMQVGVAVGVAVPILPHKRPLNRYTLHSEDGRGRGRPRGAPHLAWPDTGDAACGPQDSDRSVGSTTSRYVPCERKTGKG